MAHGPVWEKPHISFSRPELVDVGVPIVSCNPHKGRSHCLAVAFKQLKVDVLATDQSSRDCIAAIVRSRNGQNAGEGKVIEPKWPRRIDQLSHFQWTDPNPSAGVQMPTQPISVFGMILRLAATHGNAGATAESPE